MILSRRSLLKLGAVVAGCGLGAWQVRRPGPAAVAAPAAVESASPARRLLIVNADDFGMADDINRGIVEVSDLTRRKTIHVRKGKSYLAPAHG